MAVKSTLKIFQRRLLNLSAKNRSLLLLRLVKRLFIDVQDFDFANNQPAFQIIADLLERKASVDLCPVLDSRNAGTNELSSRLDALLRADRFIYDETGSKDLYVGYPFVHGQMLDGSLVRAPLLFIPVELQKSKNVWQVKLRYEVGISFNTTLLLAFSYFNNAKVDEGLLETDFSEFSKDHQEFRTQLYELLKKAALELHFNPDTFQDKLAFFQDFKKADFQQETQLGKLKAYPEAVLGIFPQAGSYLMPDYDFLQQHDSIQDLEYFFSPNDDFHTDKALQKTIRAKASHEEELITPYPLDASQEKAIKAIKSGNSIVIQGPPGSGKSQLICNLIADYTAHGKTVLVVCQKRAALDVVYKRLKEQETDEFVALVHDFQNDRKKIYHKISHLIENVENYQTRNNSLDSIYLERKFLQISRQIDQICEELEEFKRALYDTSDCGISAKELYMTSEFEGAKINLRELFDHFHFSNHEAFLRKIRLYASYAEKLDSAYHPWAERKSFSHLQLPDLDSIKVTLETIVPYQERVLAEVESMINLRISVDECVWLGNKEQELRQLLEIVQNRIVYRFFKNSLAYTNTDALWLATRKKNMLSSFGEDGLELNVAQQEIPLYQEWLEKAMAAHKNLYDKTKWKLFAKEKPKVDELLLKNNLTDDVSSYELLLRKLDNRMNYEHNHTKLKAYEWLIEQPADHKPESWERWFDLHLSALKAKKIYLQLRNGIKYIEIEKMPYDELYRTIDFLLKTVQDVPATFQRWHTYLTEKQIHEILEGEISVERFIETVDEDFDALCEFDQLKEGLRPHEKNVVELLAEAGAFDTVETAIKVFDNSIRIAWAHYLEAKYPSLRIVSSQRLIELESNLQQYMQEKEELCKQITLMKLRERTYKEVEYNRLNNLVTYRDLKHQVDKKRSVWALRKVVNQFSHELFRLLPCWLASPETVSAIFPMEQLFDLVIFDEASQCFAEKGIPAMYRGKQVVITGDSMQLSPYDLYQARPEEAPWEQSDEERELALEVKSLLDLGSRYLSQLSLKGHYRSRSQELIDFSNRYFYGGELRFLPHYEVIKNYEPHIIYQKVDGVWENNSNLPEAERVVELLRKLLSEGKEDIGIITFNYKQQELIEDLIWKKDLNLPEKVFVKNIENVQGDEREIIIFSVGYAPDKTGKMRLNFGLLNQESGENRLNVAITRAKNAVYIISSILPGQLQVEETTNDGPKLFKKYLQYAWEVSEQIHRSIVVENRSVQHQEWYLKLRLQQDIGEELTEDLPFTDLSIKQPEGFTGMILTDDNTYFQALSAKDAHAYIPLALQNRGWRNRRYYSRQYWRNSQTLLEDLRKFISLTKNEL